MGRPFGRLAAAGLRSFAFPFFRRAPQRMIRRQHFASKAMAPCFGSCSRRTRSLGWRWPLISEYCSECAQPRNWREQFSAADLKFEVPDLKCAAPVPPEQPRQHGAHLTRRASRDVDEGKQFIWGAALESLGDV